MRCFVVMSHFKISEKGGRDNERTGKENAEREL